MGTLKRRKQLLAASTGPVSWDIRAHDDFDLPFILLKFGTIPMDIANVKVWVRDAVDSGNDYIIRSQDPNNMLYLSFECINGMTDGDYITVQYDNNNGVLISGKAVIEL